MDPVEEKIIRDNLLDAMRDFDQLRDKLVYNPNKVAIKQYMAEWDVKEDWEIEESIEQRETSTVHEAARQLGIDYDELNDWLCKNIY